MVQSNRERDMSPALSYSFFLGRGASQYGDDGLPVVSSPGDFGFGSKILSKGRTPERRTPEGRFISSEVCLSDSGHPALRTLPPRDRPHSWRPGTHGDKSDCPWPSATIFRRAAVVRLNVDAATSRVPCPGLPPGARYDKRHVQSPFNASGRAGRARNHRRSVACEKRRPE